MEQLIEVVHSSANITIRNIPNAKINSYNSSLSVKFPKQAGYSWGFSFYD